MKTKLLKIIFTTITAFAIFFSQAATETVDGITWTYSVSGGKASVGGGSYSSYSSRAVPKWTSGAITIPSTLGGYPVTSIGNYAFNYCSSLTSVTIPDGVTSIGESAFGGCHSLTSVKIPDSVTSIGGSAFHYCSSLTSVTIPDGVTSIRTCAFTYCSSLESVTIPDGVTSIGGSAFAYCSSLTSVMIGDSVTSIEGGAFLYCTSLARVTLGDAVTSIGDMAFFGCRLLTSIMIPDCVTNIGEDAFYDCSSLTSVTIPDSVTSIGECAFGHCRSLKSATIGDSVTSIGEKAFRNCSSLTNITIPDSVTSIGDEAFYDCSSLTGVTIGDSVTNIGDNAFSCCSSLTSVTIPNSVTSIGDQVFEYCRSLTSMTIGDSVTSIGDSVFRYCSSLTSVTIPDSVTSIGDSAFEWCESLMSVTIGDNVTSIGNDAFENCNAGLYDTTTIPGVTLVDGWAIDSDGLFSGNLDLAGVRGIGSYAFYCCSWLTSVTIPNSVTSIGESAFGGCCSLTSVTIPNSVTNIGESAFYGCSFLTSVTIPDSVTSIGYRAFFWCDSLVSVIFEGDAPVVGNWVFYGVSADCTVYVKPGSSGWGVQIPGKWQGLNIQYIDSMPTPTPEPNPTPNPEPEPEPTPSPDPEPTPTPTPTPNPEPEPTPEIGEGGYGIGVIDGQIPENAASVYDGYLYDGDEVAGTIQAKVAKPKNDIAKVTAAIQITGEKKVSVKGELDVASGELEAVAKDGRELYLEFGSEGMSGSFGAYEIDGARNFFSSKDKGEKAVAEDVLAPWLGALNMKCPEGVLSVTIAKKGKVTIKGTYNGAKVSAKAQALIGEDMICIPVMYSKKSVNLAFTVWLPIEGTKAEIIGFDGAVIGKAGMLVNGADFNIVGDITELIPDAIKEIKGYDKVLPNGETVSVSGKKWVVADGVKAAKVTYKKGVLDIAPGKKGDEVANASGLKFTYKSKDGSFTGSFTVYAIEKGKLKKHKATVTGVLIDGIGYGTATIKKVGTWDIEIK